MNLGRHQLVNLSANPSSVYSIKDQQLVLIRGALFRTVMQNDGNAMHFDLQTPQGNNYTKPVDPKEPEEAYYASVHLRIDHEGKPDHHNAVAKKLDWEAALTNTGPMRLPEFAATVVW